MTRMDDQKNYSEITNFSSQVIISPALQLKATTYQAGVTNTSSQPILFMVDFVEA
jgi:hypothetical protein